MKSVIAIYFLLCFTSKAFAQVEYSVDAIYRSYPLSGTVTGKLGYGYRFWGSGAGDSPLYGYIKPEVRYATAVTYNEGSVRLKFFPLSILGVTAGASAIANHDRYRAYDCLTYNCQGKFWQTFVEGTAGFGWRAWFAYGKAGIEDWHQDSAQTFDFVNPTYGLVMKADGERIHFANGVTGFKLSADWVILYSYLWAQTQEINGQSQMHLGLVDYRLGQFKIAVGGGVFSSELKDKEATAIVRLQWAPTTSVELF